MGYISVIHLIMYKEDYEALKDETQKFQDHYGYPNYYPFWDMPDGKIVNEITHDGEIYIHYQTDVKMYSFDNDCYRHEDIDWFKDFVTSRHAQYTLIRIGEELEDIETVFSCDADDNFYDLVGVHRSVTLGGN